MGWMKDATRRGGRETGKEEEREKKRLVIWYREAPKERNVPEVMLGPFPQCSIHTKTTVCRGKLLPRTDWSSPTANCVATLFYSEEHSERP